MSKIKTCLSLYSLQNEYMTKRMTLEDIFRFMKDNSIEGVEFLPDQMMHGAPHPSEENLENWDRLCREYGVKPVIADVFLNTNLYKNRELTKKECVDLLIDEIRLAHRLGMKMIRLVSMTPAFVLEPLLPYCEKYDIKMGLEIHAGLSFDKQKTKDYITEMKRLNSPYAGLVIDTGIFCKRVPQVMENYCRAMGTGEAPIEFVDRMFDIGFDEVEHSDSDGIATPRDIADYFQVILEKHPDPARHSFHIHDIRGMGIAGYYAAMLAGIRTFDCTVGGIGGQVANFLDGVPVKGAGDYYFDTCRTGLVSTEDFITMVNGMGIHTGVDQEKLYALGRNLEKMLGRPLYSFTSTVRSGLGA